MGIYGLVGGDLDFVFDTFHSVNAAGNLFDALALFFGIHLAFQVNDTGRDVDCQIEQTRMFRTF